MPDTRLQPGSPFSEELLYAVYELVVPIITSCLVSFVVNSAVMARVKEEGSDDDNSWEVTLYFLNPVLSFLVAESLSSSGLSALLFCALL